MNKRTSSDSAYDKCRAWVLYVGAQDKGVGIPPDCSVKGKEGFSWEVKLEPHWEMNRSKLEQEEEQNNTAC